MRRLVALSVVPMLMFALSACGGDDPSASPSTSPSVVQSGEAIPGVTVSGEFGEEPKVMIDTPLELENTQSQVVSSGDGDAVRADANALLHLYVANGSTGKKAAATFDEGQPVNVSLSEGQLFPAVLDAVVGKPAGSRIAVAAVPADAYPEGADQIGISKDDNVVFVVDVMSVAPSDVLDGPKGEAVEVPADLPGVEEEGGDVTKLTFDDAPKEPSNELQVIPLVEGTGAPARKGSLVTFDYFGQVYGTDKVFDESYSKEPVTFPLGTGGLIKGWDEGLVGVKQGSRVMIIAPPEFGYGAQGNPQAGIKGTDTLAFVVDILGVS